LQDGPYIADLLLLDETTNHLDMEASVWIARNFNEQQTGERLGVCEMAFCN
jgi:ATPase subunit of ABC transporter with duplicated ATPase domains